MGIIVDRNKILEKTTEMDRHLEAAAKAAERTMKALEGVQEHEGELKGLAWDSVRRYLRDVQRPVHGLYVSWIQAQLAGNRKFRDEAAYLPISYMDEDSFHSRISEYSSTIRKEKRREDPSKSLIRYCEQKIALYEQYLDRLHTFVRRTTHIYEEAASYQRLLEQEDAELSKVHYDPQFQAIDYSNIDRKWLNEIREKTAGDDPENRYKVSAEEILQEIYAFWDRQGREIAERLQRDGNYLATVSFIVMTELRLTGKCERFFLQHAGKWAERIIAIRDWPWEHREYICVQMGNVFEMIWKIQQYPKTRALFDRFSTQGKSLGQKIREEQEQMLQRAEFLGITPKEYMSRYQEIQIFWGADNNMFEKDFWWQDEKNMEHAYEMLQKEAELTGGIDVFQEGAVLHNASNPSMKIYALQAMYNSTRTGYFDEELLNQLQTIMSNLDNPRDIYEMKYILDSEALKAGWESYENIILRESGNWLERNSEFRDMWNEIALAVIICASEGKKAAEREKELKELRKHPGFGDTLEEAEETLKEELEGELEGELEKEAKTLEIESYESQIPRFGEVEGGSKSKIGDFTNLEGSTVDDILDRIPDEATLRELYPVEGGATEGFEFKWVQDGQTYRVRVHNADPGAPAGSNAANGWTLRIQRGTQYYDYTINEFQPARFTNPNGPFFDESIMNNTHIPILDPYAK